MPALSEFNLTLGRRRNEENGCIVTFFRFVTVRQFHSFQYEIQIEDSLDEAARTIDFRIHGVHAPANLMPGAGTAFKDIGYPGLRGEYLVTCHGAKQSGTFRFLVDEEGIFLTQPPQEDGLPVQVEKGIENVRM